MSDTLQRWRDRIEAEHAAEVDRGEHDECCESRPNSRLCHCSKRRREAAGYTEPPGEVIWMAPTCPRCHEELDVDADGFTCQPCCASWGHDGQQSTFTDDYGDLATPAPSEQIAAERAMPERAR